MEYEFFTTNDNTKIAYQTSQPFPLSVKQDAAAGAKSEHHPSTCILLLHGFSGSSAYFSRNMSILSSQQLQTQTNHLVIAPDMRGHGRSQHTPHGYHVARLAMDLHELITTRIQTSFSDGDRPLKIYAVGCSIGAAVLWTYIELFTDQDFAGLVFVDQAPLQDRSTLINGDDWGPERAHYGCYDEATMLEAQKAWASPDAHVREGTYAGLVASCLGYVYRPLPSDHISEEQRKEDEEFFAGISRTCDGSWLARLLADHTRYDHREAIELISKPVLVTMGKRSGCFSVDGMTETVRRANKNRTRGLAAEPSLFDSGHWLFWEEPEKFNQELLDFVKRCEQST